MPTTDAMLPTKATANKGETKTTNTTEPIMITVKTKVTNTNKVLMINAFIFVAPVCFSI